MIFMLTFAKQFNSQEWMYRIQVGNNNNPDKIMLEEKLIPLVEPFDSIKETKFCISQSRQWKEQQKKQQFMNKLSFRYSLSKINKEKMIGNVFSYTNRQYPQVACQGRKFTANQYCSPRVRANRQSFISYREQQPLIEHQEEVKRYSQILNKQKQKQQRGLGSFWMFKKQVSTQGRKSRAKKSQSQIRSAMGQRTNQVQQAFSRIFIFGKLSVDLQSGLISHKLFKNYLSSILGQNFAEWFLNFFQIKSYINFKQFQKLGQKLSQMTLRESHLLTFMMFDRNGDGFICPRDVFYIFQKQLDSSIQNDVIKISQFAQANEGRQEQINQQFKIEHVIIQDDNLCIKDYDVIFRKVDEPFLKATNKKDTGFAKTFAVLEHRQKIRSKRREMNQKKMMYNELFQQIQRDNKNNAFVESGDYRLNYTFLYQAFENKPSKLFVFFCKKVMGVAYHPQRK